MKKVFTISKLDSIIEKLKEGKVGKNKMKKSVKIIIMLGIMCLILLATNAVFASTKSIIVKASNSDLIYNSDVMDDEFTFAFAKTNSKEGLIFFSSAKDSTEDNAKNVAYVDDTTKGYLEDNKEGYLFVRNTNGDYVIEGEKIVLDNSIDKDLVETTTKRISVDLSKSTTSQETIDGVLTSVTKGKVVITDDDKNNYSYMLVAVTDGSQYENLMKLADKISNTEEMEKLSFVEKLQLTGEFYELYKKLVPETNDSSWEAVNEMEILQPENSKNGDQYIVFIKSEKDNDIVIDAQFMTCFDKYSPLYEKEQVTVKETTKLPVTYDFTITLIGILAIIIIAIVVILFVVKRLNKKEANK